MKESFRMLRNLRYIRPRSTFLPEMTSFLRRSPVEKCWYLTTTKKSLPKDIIGNGCFRHPCSLFALYLLYFIWVYIFLWVKSYPGQNLIINQKHKHS